MAVSCTLSDGNRNDLRMDGFLENTDSNSVKVRSSEFPLLTIELSLLGASVFESFSFEEKSLSTFGKLFEELPAAERGKLWAAKFEELLTVEFASGGVCEIRDAPFSDMMLDTS